MSPPKRKPAPQPKPLQPAAAGANNNSDSMARAALFNTECNVSQVMIEGGVNKPVNKP